MCKNKNYNKLEKENIEMCSMCLCEQRVDPRTAISLKPFATFKSPNRMSAYNAQHDTCNTAAHQFGTCDNSLRQDISTNTIHTNPSQTSDIICHLKARNSRHMQICSKKKFFICFLILFWAAELQTAYASPVKLSGKHLILHTNEYRQRYHQKLIQQQRTEIPTTTHHHHHLHHRSSGNMPDQQNLNCLTNLYHYYNAREQMDFAHNRTLGTLNSNLLPYQYDKTNTEMKNEWSEHKLNLSHPHKGFDHNNITLPRNLKELKTQTHLMMQHLNKFKHVYEQFNNNFSKANSTHDSAYEMIKKHHDETYASIVAMMTDLNKAYNDGKVHALPEYTGEIEDNSNTKVLDYKLSEHFLEILEIYKKIFDHFLCPKTKLH